MVLSSGRCAPCSLASSIEDSTSRPSELRKRTLVLVLGQVVLTEPLRFRLGHPMDHSNAAGSSLVASLPEMRTAHALACPLMGYVCRFVAMCSWEFLLRETQFGGLRRKEKRISAFRGCETPSRPTKKRLRAASNFVGGTLPLTFAR